MSEGAADAWQPTCEACGSHDCGAWDTEGVWLCRDCVSDAEAWLLNASDEELAALAREET